MNWIEKILYALQAEMKRPEPFGWFHLIWISFIVVSLAFLYKHKKNYNEKQLKCVLGVYGIVAFVLELIKQTIWSFNYDAATGIITWDYQWYAAPFQLCTTPIYVCLLCLFLNKHSVLRKSLLSYVAFVTIIGSVATILMPGSCFTKTIVVNIHTMWMHYGSFVVSLYLLMTGEIELTCKNLKNAFGIFLLFVGFATALNVGVYQSGMLNGETFNMFYISPYFVSDLPVFDVIQQNMPYSIYLLIYIIALGLGSVIIYYFAKGIEIVAKNLSKRKIPHKMFAKRTIFHFGKH